ncbi:protein of unknown function [Hyphomicrobium sp. 1Nfss2.1]|uniref:hypothetical protein n=1 Tax=Hyphomicrobium sp. 1Nfss2.1 TaxID=3413936 RepID=UPI003C7CC73D
MSDLKSLLERVEKATGPDHPELDADDLDTILIIARNGQSGRITPSEVEALVEGYRALIAQQEAKEGTPSTNSDEGGR